MPSPRSTADRLAHRICSGSSPSSPFPHSARASRRSCAATRPVSGGTGAPTRGARATRRSIRSTRPTSTACRWRGSGTPASTATTSTTGRRRSTRTAGCSRWRRRAARVRDRSGERQDAVDLEAGRRHPVAEGATPVRRPRTRLLDRRPRQRTRGRRDARIPHGDPRREDGQGDPRSARTASSI